MDKIRINERLKRQFEEAQKILQGIPEQQRDNYGLGRYRQNEVVGSESQHSEQAILYATQDKVEVAEQG